MVRFKPIFSEREQGEHGEQNSPLLNPKFNKTATIIGLEAQDLARDVRQRRGTVFHGQVRWVTGIHAGIKHVQSLGPTL